MAALATLSSTSLVTPAGSSDTAVQLLSTSGVLPGLRLVVDQEAMQVVSLGLGAWVNVLRGVDGTSGVPHVSSAPVWIGRADQFYTSNPVGSPPTEVLVTPWINLMTGEQWTAQGDETGPNVARYWLRTLHTRGIGSMGVRTDATGAATTTVS